MKRAGMLADSKWERKRMRRKLKKITLCVDMQGCPNRCRHCWIGHSPNKKQPLRALEYAAKEFYSYCDKLEVYSWYREPDFRDDYTKLWELENELSKNCSPQRYELLSVWRLNRDKKYIEWLKGFDISTYQLTFFGMEDKTDYYTGRKGAFKELIDATDILLENGMVPRWQVFIYGDNVRETESLINLADELNLEEKCENLGERFDVFCHQGSCEGEGRKLYDNWITLDDAGHIPQKLIESSKIHFKCDSVQGFLGKPECELMEGLENDDSFIELPTENATFFMDCNFDVYPNFSENSKWWLLGNLKKDGAVKIVENYRRNASAAQKAAEKISVREMAQACGDKPGKRLFLVNDYKMYLLNTYCEKKFI